MTQPTERRRLDAFVDGELDLQSQIEVEALMREDRGVNAQVQDMRQLRNALRGGADYHLAPEQFRARLRSQMVALPAAPSAVFLHASLVGRAQMPERAGSAARWSLSRLTRWLSGWFAWPPLTASLATAAVMMLVLNLTGVLTGHDDRVMGDVLSSHVRATAGQHLVDVASSDHHTVKPWLSSKLGFSPPVSELPLPGATFLGGRVDVINGRPVAALAYRYGKHVVNSYLWPVEAKDSAPKFASQRGYHMAHWSRGGMNHWVIADVNPDEFAVIVRTLAADDPVR